MPLQQQADGDASEALTSLAAVQRKLLARLEGAHAALAPPSLAADRHAMAEKQLLAPSGARGTHELGSVAQRFGLGG
ncbi:ATP-dependent DNA helicase [Micractinium conductrix]|uniref:ATP-dependent DNA helicase n=1 Tax=Micractinium conductrix TaxID=554055 RepID=A0A2P6V7H8_9CHLO|nr:ATP-dependent DNA helicase [Micractinium conductrix]|eukprot:PSC70044.1 ATP-dependent DNA helicase [Micractinium conductrix]